MRHVRWKTLTVSCPFKGLKSVSEHGAAESTHTTREEDVVKPKDIEKLKVLKLPENAGEFRGWLNSENSPVEPV